jgi:hypothetical protein
MGVVVAVVVCVVVGVVVVVNVAVVVRVVVAVVRAHPVNDPSRNALVIALSPLTTSSQLPCTFKNPPRVQPTESPTIGGLAK